MSTDHAKIYVKGGDGGNGCISFLREKFRPNGGPNGGNGGWGGSVYLEANENIATLNDFYHQVHFRAEGGGHGSGDDRHGRSSEDLVLFVPRGTLIVDDATGEVLGDLVDQGQRALVGQGGRGGRGNASYATHSNTAPRIAQKGEPGQERWIVLDVKVIADVGIVGYPNAGKSTLLAAISSASPKIADYPFTTLTPNLGVVDMDGETRVVFADIPGLIEGAHQGVGLGDRFLRHVERTRLLVHLMDLTQVDLEAPLVAWEAVNKEITAFNPALSQVPQIAVGTKLDLPEAPERAAFLKKAFAKAQVPFVAISALQGQGLKPLLAEVLALLPAARPAAPLQTPAPVPVLRPAEASAITVDPLGHTFVVRGEAVERFVAMTNTEHDEGVRRLQEGLKRLGVEKALKNAGVRPGDTVRIKGFEFVYQDEDESWRPPKRNRRSKGRA